MTMHIGVLEEIQAKKTDKELQPSSDLMSKIKELENRADQFNEAFNKLASCKREIDETLGVDWDDLKRDIRDRIVKIFG